MGQPVKIAQINQVLPGQSRLVRVQGRDVALFNVEGTFYATDNICSHSRGPLVEGRLVGANVTCPWHGAKFSVITGECLSGPATAGVEVYTIHIKDEAIFVEMP